MTRWLPLLLLVGCSTPPTLTVGYKDFAEQRILAHVLGATLERAGYRVTRPRPCGDTDGCHRALRAGEIDVMVEYTGTGLSFAGAPHTGDALARLREIYGPRGVRWLTPLGFDNNYQVLVRPDDPAQSIEDLSGAFDLAVPAPFMTRPRDGYAAFTSRYGLQQAKPVVIADVAQRYAALASGQVRAIVGYGTDGPRSERPFRNLRDSLAFFPAYQAVVIARDPHDVGPALAPLEGRIPAAAMQKMNAEVALAGHRPAAVAQRFLAEVGLTTAAENLGPTVRVAVRPEDGLDAHALRARTAARAAFPQRPVEIVPTSDPLADVESGRARLGVVGAERFAKPADVAAAAVLGLRYLHLLRRDTGPLAGPVGVTAGSGADMATALLAQHDVKPARVAPAKDLIQAVREGSLDGALFLAAADDPAIKSALEQGLQLAAPPRPATPLPFMRAARLPSPSGTVDTLAAQVLLVGPGQPDQPQAGAGPAAAIAPAARPLSRAEIATLAEVSAGGEAPDPRLPTAWRPAEASAPPALRDTLLNLFALAFLAWVGVLALGRKEKPADG